MAGNESSTLTAATEDRTARLLSTAHPFLLEQMTEYGPGYFNPLIGATHAQTFENLADMCGFLYDLKRKDLGVDLEDRAVPLILQMMWTAAQYSSRVCEPSDNASRGAATQKGSTEPI